MTTLGMRQHRHHLKPQLHRLLSAPGRLLTDSRWGRLVLSLTKSGIPQFAPDQMHERAGLPIMQARMAVGACRLVPVRAAYS